MDYIKKISFSYKAIILAIFLILIAVLLSNKDHWKESKVVATQVFPSLGLINETPSAKIVDYNNKSAESCSKDGCELTFNLDGQRVNKIFFSFDYSYAPDRYDIYGVQKGKESLIDRYDKTRGFQDFNKYNPSFRYNESALGVRPYYSSYVSGAYDSIRVKIFPIPEERVITVNDVFFYKTEPVSQTRFLYNLFLVHQRSIFSYVFYLMLFSIVVFSSGFLIVDNILKEKYKDYEKILLSFAIGLLFWGAIGLVSNKLGRNFGTSLSFLLMVFSFIYFFIGKSFSRLKIDLNVIKITIFFACFVLLYIFIFDGGLRSNALSYKNDVYFDNTVKYDVHPGSYWSDEIVPYGSAKILLYNLDRNSKEYIDLVASNILSLRTQLFSYMTVPFLKIFGDRLFIYEILGLSCVVFIPISVYLLAIRMTGDKKSTYLAMFFVFISPYLIYMITVTQIKVICTVLITAFFYFIYKYKTDNDRKDLIAASILASISILIHNFTLMYVIAGIVYLQPNIFKWLIKKNIKSFCIVMAPVIVFLIWLAYSYFDAKAVIVTTISDTRSALLINAGYFKEKFGDNYQMVAPYLNRYLNFKGFFIADPAPMITYRTEGFFRATIYSLTSFVLFPFLMFSLIKFRKEYRHIWIYLLILMIITLCSDGNYLYVFGIHLYLVAAIPLLLVLASKVIDQLRIRFIVLICLLAISEATFTNFIVFSNLIDLKNMISQYPFYTLVIFLSMIALSFSPLYYLIKSEES